MFFILSGYCNSFSFGSGKFADFCTIRAKFVVAIIFFVSLSQFLYLGGAGTKKVGKRWARLCVCVLPD